jgi:hypothetical protein
MAASADGHGRTRGEFCYSVIHAVAWTLTDLAGRTSPGRDEVAVALSYLCSRLAAQPSSSTSRRCRALSK